MHTGEKPHYYRFLTELNQISFMFLKRLIYVENSVEISRVTWKCTGEKNFIYVTKWRQHQCNICGERFDINLSFRSHRREYICLMLDASDQKSGYLIRQQLSTIKIEIFEKIDCLKNLLKMIELILSYFNSLLFKYN